MRTVHKDAHNTIIYKLDGYLHREDGPAVEWANGDKEWYLNGYLHREDGPAIEDIDGHKEWAKHGRRHRDNGPAYITHDGNEYWFLNGKRIWCSSNEEFLRLVKLKALW